jgi:AraC family transcriptional regulator
MTFAQHISDAAPGRHEMVARVYHLHDTQVETRDLSMFRPQPFPIHQHEGVFQIGFAVAGSSQIERQGRRMGLAPWQFHVINPGELHTAYGEDPAPWRFRYLNLPRETVVSVLEAEMPRAPVAVSTPDDRVYEGSTISTLFSRFFEADLRSEMETEELLVQLIMTMRNLFGVAAPMAKPRAPYAGVRRALQYLQERYAESVRLADVAAFARTSPFHLCRHFASVVSISPHQYLLNVRISRAKEMLQHARHADLTSIAQATGFYDQAHFVKSFKARTGLTPSGYRQLFTPRRQRGPARSR